MSAPTRKTVTKRHEGRIATRADAAMKASPVIQAGSARPEPS